jgi:hypothetical protein
LTGIASESQLKRQESTEIVSTVWEQSARKERQHFANNENSITLSLLRPQSRLIKTIQLPKKALKNTALLDVTPYGSCNNRRFGGKCHLHHQSEKSQRSTLQLLLTANVVPVSPILVTLMMEAIRSTESSVLTRATRHHIPKNGFPHNHCWENFKSYIALSDLAL